MVFDSAPFVFSVEDDAVTMRERDSQSQVRLPIEEVATVLRGLVDGSHSWQDITARFPAAEQKDKD